VVGVQLAVTRPGTTRSGSGSLRRVSQCLFTTRPRWRWRCVGRLNSDGVEDPRDSRGNRWVCEGNARSAGPCRSGSGPVLHLLSSCPMDYLWTGPFKATLPPSELLQLQTHKGASGALQYSREYSNHRAVRATAGACGAVAGWAAAANSYSPHRIRIGECAIFSSATRTWL
jgi:hypothetical protein